MSANIVIKARNTPSITSFSVSFTNKISLFKCKQFCQKIFVIESAYKNPLILVCIGGFFKSYYCRIDKGKTLWFLIGYTLLGTLLLHRASSNLLTSCFIPV